MLNLKFDKVMKRIFSASVLCVCLCICGCSLMQERGFFFESYVIEYVNIDYEGEPKIQCDAKNKVAVSLPTERYAFYVWDGISDVWKQSHQNWAQLHERHRELSRKNGDIGFDQIIDLEVWGTTGVVVWNTDNVISAITITSSEDYDNTHPAGVSLNDIVQITYTTHKPFIENGYKHMIEVDGVLQFDKHRSTNDYSGDRVTKVLSELTPADAIFMDVDSFSLSFVNQPTSALNHTFSVTIDFEHSEPYSFSFDRNFASAE